MSTRAHWDEVYRNTSPDSVSWYQPRLQRSLALIEGCGLNPSAHVVDVGGGASTWWTTSSPEASSARPDVVEGRFVATSMLRKRNWEIILEPIGDEELTVVITAYPLEERSRKDVALKLPIGADARSRPISTSHARVA